MRDTRTLFDLAGVKVDRGSGTHHNALDDACAQAEATVKALTILKPEPKRFAWAALADNGNVIIWSLSRAEVEPVAAKYGRPVVPVALPETAFVSPMQANQAALDVLAERRRQIEAEGYDTRGDDGNVQDELAAYAAFYAMPPAVRDWPATETGYGSTWGRAIVPWSWSAPKPGNRRRELVKAGALILAEIERIDRAQQDNVGNTRVATKAVVQLGEPADLEPTHRNIVSSHENSQQGS